MNFLEDGLSDRIDFDTLIKLFGVFDCPVTVWKFCFATMFRMKVENENFKGGNDFG